MVNLDLVSVAVVAVFSGFGSAFGVEIPKAIVEYFKKLKVVSFFITHLQLD